MFPIRKVVLHKNGQAYFERTGTVDGTQQITLEFGVDEMDDVLRSLRVVDESGGRVDGITYDSASTELRTVGRPPVFIPTDNSMGAVLAGMQGINVQLVYKTETKVTGRIMGITLLPPQEKGLEPCHMIDIAAPGNQLLSCKKDDIKSITILDDKLPASLSAYLDYAVAKRDNNTRKVTVTCAGEGKRNVSVSYTTFSFGSTAASPPPTTSVFGSTVPSSQTSTFGSTAPAYRTPSAPASFGSSTTSGFGTTAASITPTTGTSSAFGTTPSFGAIPSATPAFGTTSTTPSFSTPAFGTITPASAPPTTRSVFGQAPPTQTTTPPTIPAPSSDSTRTPPWAWI